VTDKLKRPVSSARKKANAEFAASAYDRIELKVSKGKKNEIKAHAEKHQLGVGEIGKAGYSPAGSLQGFINRAIDETMKRDNNTQEPTPPAIENKLHAAMLKEHTESQTPLCNEATQ